ncbi:uncharacterized protein N7496_012021 [Penicillium cataractarum]|uniref:Uncharacterized protein n=1 Tax=Penicillium cataractarum TaxID=2100454 RepID=A0A9W9RL86_9EURO|nr:uncharacterized protein N7496_012021 [Penicillium cataractarum]KAJ5359608.1 hypothetical protein N7496_012021 [Penicillium cataractarum]
MSTPCNFEVNGLYILLTDRGENSFAFHWGFYLHQSGISGCIYHLINDDGPASWRFDSRLSENVMFSQRLLAAIKIGVIDLVLHQALPDRLQEIPIAYSTRFHESITCRVWLKEALFALDDEGYVKLTRSVDEIEAEAKILAIQNKSMGQRTVSRSVGTLA